jgi:hypothetical protein
LGDAREQVDNGLVVPERVRGEPGDGAADVVAGIECGRRRDGAVEKALAERAVGTKPMPSSSQVASTFSSGRRHHSEYSLWTADGLHRVRPTDGWCGSLGQAEVLGLAGFDEVLDRAGDVFDGHLWVDPVLVVEVDGVDAEPVVASRRRRA